MPLTQIPREQWVEVVERNANGESLRHLAKVYGVSHEAVRQIVKRMGH
jgi:Mor family transcriptional regulator